MKERIRIALKWKEDQKVVWHVLGIPDELRDHDQDNFGIWICLIATTVAGILKGQPNFSLQMRTLRCAARMEDIIMMGREAIIKSIGQGRIKDPQQEPFCSVRIVKSNKKGQQRLQGVET